MHSNILLGMLPGTSSKVFWDKVNQKLSNEEQEQDPKRLLAVLKKITMVCYSCLHERSLPSFFTLYTTFNS